MVVHRITMGVSEQRSVRWCGFFTIIVSWNKKISTLCNSASGALNALHPNCGQRQCQQPTAQLIALRGSWHGEFV